MNTATTAPGTLRLTRRGRIVVFGAALLLVLLTGVILSSTVVATDSAGEPVATQVVIVQPGETLWDIATTIHPGGDLRDTVEDILRLNHLDSPAGLQMGQELHLPIYE